MSVCEVLPATGTSTGLIVVLAVVATATGLALWRIGRTGAAVVALLACGLAATSSRAVLAADDCPPATAPATTAVSVSTTTAATNPATTPSTTPTTEPSPPVAVNDNASTQVDSAVTIEVLANDIGDGPGIVGNTDPTNGTVFLNPIGTFTYTPNGGFVGTDTFTYTIEDATGLTDTATVTITVLPRPPVALADFATTPFETPVTIAVLANDIGDGPGIVPGSATDPSNGSVVIEAIGTITYTPDAGFSGADTFEYTIQDATTGTAVATVTVTVEPPGT